MKKDRLGALTTAIGEQNWGAVAAILESDGDCSALLQQARARPADWENLRRAAANARIEQITIAGVRGALKIRIDELHKAIRKGPSQPKSKRRARNVVLDSFEEIEAERIPWLWEGYLPLQRTHLLDGDPGVSKSTLVFDLAARVSTGAAWPDGTPNRLGPGVALIMSSEDSPGDTIKPRLMAAGGDMSRIFFVPPAQQYTGSEDVFFISLPGDLDQLEAAVRGAMSATKAPYAYLIIDPLMGFLDTAIDSYKDTDVRQAMVRLEKMCKSLNATVTCIRHFTKGSAGKLIHQGIGSVGLVAAARVASSIVLDPTDEIEAPHLRRRLFLHTKFNLAALPPTLAYRVESVDISIGGRDTSQPKIVWLGSSDVTTKYLEELVANPGGVGSKGKPKTELAHLLVIAVLHQGPMREKDVREYLKSQDISKRTLERAVPKRVLQKKTVGSSKAGTQEWWWALTQEHLSWVQADGSLLRPGGGLEPDEHPESPRDTRDGGLDSPHHSSPATTTKIETATGDETHAVVEAAPVETATSPNWRDLLRLAATADLEDEVSLSDVIRPEELEELGKDLHEAVAEYLAEETRG